MNKMLRVFLCLFILSNGFISAQEEVNLNEYYRYPLSGGIEYQSRTPLTDLGNEFSVSDLSGIIRYPLPSAATLVPLLKLGYMRFDSLDPLEPDKWDHFQFYALGGIGYANRFVENFEVGADIGIGISEAVFPSLVDSGAVGMPMLIANAGGKVTLNPSYNVSVDLRPNVSYMHALNPLDELNGFTFGLGFSVHYRFGEDPARALIRSLRLIESDVPSLFSAMQSYYAKNPIGSVVIQNTDSVPIENLEVSFLQAEYMIAPTPSEVIAILEPDETATVELLASFNAEVFKIEGVAPLTGEVVIQYSRRGRPVEQRLSVTYDLYDKTSLTWDDERKVGAFITPSDSAIGNYASFIRKAAQSEVFGGFNGPTQTAIQAYHALTEIGCLYQADPSSPFTQVQENTLSVDSVKLPRDTLKRGTGDCDDLTVLYASILESVGIETGFITVPGHIYVAVNTKVPGRRYREIHPDREMTIDVDDELWVPVEITMLGRGSFLDAWRQGSELWNRYEDQTDVRGFHTTVQSQVVYRPVGLVQTDLGLQYGDSKTIAKEFKRDLNRIADIIIAEYETAAADGGKKDLNRLGMRYIAFERYFDAERVFERAVRGDENYLPAIVNLGNTAYLRGRYDDALSYYIRAEEILTSKERTASPTYSKVLVNISQVYHRQEKYDDAKNYFAKAESVDPEGAAGFAYLGSSDSQSRAADLGSLSAVIMLDSEEEE